MTQYAIHSLHSPPVEWHNGTYTIDGKAHIPLGDPIHVAETFDQAEQWRVERLKEVMSI